MKGMKIMKNKLDLHSSKIINHGLHEFHESLRFFLCNP
jgi:hypothetical protein